VYIADVSTIWDIKRWLMDTATCQDSERSNVIQAWEGLLARLENDLKDVHPYSEKRFVYYKLGGLAVLPTYQLDTVTLHSVIAIEHHLFLSPRYWLFYLNKDRKVFAVYDAAKLQPQIWQPGLTP
jgi:hypothetical protein